MQLKQKIGDDVVYVIPLRDKKLAFVPGSEWNLIFTLKQNKADTDAEAKMQKQTGTGITHNGSNALVAIVPMNTTGGTFTPVGEVSPVTVAALNEGVYLWDVQAQHLTTNVVRTVAEGLMFLSKDVTRGTVTSVPMYVAQAPAPTRGLEGDSAYQVAVANGFVGDETAWLASLVGPTDETTSGILTKLAPGTGGTGTIGAEYQADALSGAGVPTLGTFATGTVDFTGIVPVQGYTCYVQGQSIVWKNSPSGIYEVTVDSPSFPSSEASKFAYVVRNAGLGVTASSSGNVVTLTANVPGLSGNDTGGMSGGVMSGGTAGVTASYLGQLYRNTVSSAWYRWTGADWQEDASVTVVDALTNGDMSAVTSNAVFDAMALKAPLNSPVFTTSALVLGPVTTNSYVQATGNVATASGQFNGAGTGLTGTAAGLTAGTVTTIGGKITQGTNVTISGAGTAGDPYNISSSGGGSSTWASLSDKATAELPTDNTPLVAALALKSRATPLSQLFPAGLARHQNTALANQQLTLWTFGDSMMSSPRLPLGLGWLLHQKVPIIGYALEELLTSSLTGTVIAPPANSNGTASPTLWDVGKVWKLSNAGSVRVQNGNGSLVGILSSKAVFYFSMQTAGGDAAVDYSRDGGATWVNMGTFSTAGTVGSLGRVEYTPAAGLLHYLYRVTATTGSVNYIGAKVWDNTRSGVILCNSNMGGISVESTMQAQAGVRNGIAADMGSVVLVTQFLEGNNELTETILNNFLDGWTTALPNGEIILIDQSDVPSRGDSVYTAQVNALYAAAKAARQNVKTYPINAILGSEQHRERSEFFNNQVGVVTVNAATNVFTLPSAHDFALNMKVLFTTTNTLPTPLLPWTRTTSKVYYVKTVPTTTTFTLSETSGGGEIDVTGIGTGTHTLHKYDVTHMSDVAWHYLGADFAEKLINQSVGPAVGQTFKSASGSKEVFFGNLADEHSPGSWFFRMPRLGKQRWGITSISSLGGTTRFGFNWQVPGAAFPDGVIMEFANDGAYKTPITIDNTGYLVFGPYNATTQSGYTRGARVVVDEDSASKSALIARHRSATPTAPIIKAENSAGVSRFQVWDTGAVVQCPPASITPTTNGDLVIEATSNTSLTIKHKGTDGVVRSVVLALI